jgi:predicted RecB family nuclease
MRARRASARVPLELHPGYPKRPDKEMGEIVSAMHSYFVEFDEKYHPSPLAVEQVIFHKVLKYAGTADFVCMIDGKVWLLDWKSAGRFEPDKKPYENYSAQLSAYQEALRHMGRFTVEKLAVVYLAPEGFVFAESPGDMPRFMEALKLCTGAKPPTPPK